MFCYKKTPNEIKILYYLLECDFCNLKTKNKDGNTLAHLICKSQNCPLNVSYSKKNFQLF